MRLARNFAVIAAIALLLTVLPGGGKVTSTILTALTLAFLGSLAWFVYRAHLDNALTLDSLSEGWRALHFAAIGLLVFLVAGADEMLASGAGTLAWIALLALSVFALVRVFQESRAY
jgi:hypothetical protein